MQFMGDDSKYIESDNLLMFIQYIRYISITDI